MPCWLLCRWNVHPDTCVARPAALRADTVLPGGRILVLLVYCMGLRDHEVEVAVSTLAAMRDVLLVALWRSNRQLSSAWLDGELNVRYGNPMRRRAAQ